MYSLLFGLLSITVARCYNYDYYTAAVYEHVVKGDYKNDATKEYIQKNLATYSRVASIASNAETDILIFPEFGVFPPTAREAIIDDAQYVPDPVIEQWNPCLEPERYQNSYVLANLSCAARQNNLVIVANILSKTPCNNISDSSCPEDNFYAYNTNVAFNRSGLLIARYRKTHLYYEDGLNILPEPEFIVFETDFATIGTFICFDIAWKESLEMVRKYKPDAVAFTNHWLEYIQPGMNAVQVQQSWAIVNNVTVLASNIQAPLIGTLGSGIFYGNAGIGNYVYNPDGQSRLIISEVPRRGIKPLRGIPPATIIEFHDYKPEKGDNNLTSGVCSRKILGPPSHYNDFRCRDYDLSNFTLVKVEAGGYAKGCNNGLCCRAQYKAHLRDEDYYLAVINGTYTENVRYTWWLEACFLVRCNSFEGKPCSTFPTKSKSLFRKLKLEANFSTPYVYPSISTSKLQLAPKEKWNFSNNRLIFKTNRENLLFASLYGRVYDRDPKD